MFVGIYLFVIYYTNECKTENSFLITMHYKWTKINTIIYTGSHIVIKLLNYYNTIYFLSNYYTTRLKVQKKKKKE